MFSHDGRVIAAFRFSDRLEHGVAQGQGQAGPSTSECFTPTASPQEEEGNEQQEGEQGEGEAEDDRAGPTA